MGLKIIEPAKDSPFWPVVVMMGSLIVVLVNVVTLNIDHHSWWSLALNCTLTLSVVVRYARAVVPLAWARIQPRLS